mmetsp:Transcript_9/g.37  ORF Transcript_9/g.37 Transcript_9/m.37 type:complete len:347 (+) Transcript_9:121-1161(+)
MSSILWSRPLDSAETAAWPGSLRSETSIWSSRRAHLPFTYASFPSRLSFAKYFCAWLRICALVRVLMFCATFFHSRPYVRRPSRKASCSSRVHLPTCLPSVSTLQALGTVFITFAPPVAPFALPPTCASSAWPLAGLMAAGAPRTLAPLASMCVLDGICATSRAPGGGSAAGCSRGWPRSTGWPRSAGVARASRSRWFCGKFMWPNGPLSGGRTVFIELSRGASAANRARSLARRNAAVPGLVSLAGRSAPRGSSVLCAPRPLRLPDARLAAEPVDTRSTCEAAGTAGAAGARAAASSSGATFRTLGRSPHEARHWPDRTRLAAQLRRATRFARPLDGDGTPGRAR